MEVFCTTWMIKHGNTEVAEGILSWNYHSRHKNVRQVQVQSTVQYILLCMCYFLVKECEYRFNVKGKNMYSNSRRYLYMDTYHYIICYVEVTKCYTMLVTQNEERQGNFRYSFIIVFLFPFLWFDTFRPATLELA